MQSPVSPNTLPLIDRAAAYFRDLQDRIVAALERADGGRFREDKWDRPGGGGGRTRVLSESALFEKAGVNFSDVHGELRPEFARQLPGVGLGFRATGISLVLHPRNPHVPTVHANFRRLERLRTAADGASDASTLRVDAGSAGIIGADGASSGWFGGGADLTPYYLEPEDAVHFHRTLAAACDRHDTGFFPRWKAWCDRYFFLPHRGEPRGVGGIFFDYLGAGAEATAGEPTPPPSTALEQDPERLFAFVRGAGDAFVDAYLPIVERRRHQAFTDEERRWQLIRRGRYVEFNLVYDRGTLFGLKTDGRVESILMSLPLEARWEYCHEPAPGSREAETLAAIKSKRDWIRG